MPELTVESLTHRASVSVMGHLKVHAIHPRTVRQWTPEHGWQNLSFQQVFHQPAPPLFTAYFLHDPPWAILDLDCGAQRWRGDKHWLTIRAALRRLGFTGEQATAMYRAMKEAADDAGEE